jgi:hypothetical protein
MGQMAPKLAGALHLQPVTCCDIFAVVARHNGQLRERMITTIDAWRTPNAGSGGRRSPVRDL